jgi:hypothetical protein
VNPKDFDRIRFITRHFKELEGLERTVPTGLLSLSVGFSGFFGESFLSILLVIACWLGSFLLRRRARSYYRAIFGEVEQPQTSSSIPWSAYLLVLMILALVFVEGGGLRSDVFPRLLLSMYSAFFMCLWIWRGYRRTQVYWLALGILFLGAQPFVSIVPGDRLGFVIFLSGAAMILGGLLDHRFLVREMDQLAAPLHEIEASAATAGMETQR